MLRPLGPISIVDPTQKALEAVLRTDGGSGEQSSAEAVEQSGVAVRQAAVVALGSGARGADDRESQPIATLYTRPPPRGEIDAPRAPAEEAAPRAATATVAATSGRTPPQIEDGRSIDPALQYA